ncbi:hypothetical protein [Kineosporia mesophila]|uniref:hypothetical protein n=1 Tax=Kineosporia mesophila TaxID=566012 RepID=UPI001E40CE2B|nr:hypothetical protein [Kineosporia mesophila]MCD5349074.1 hypothetical protein [Kineosporia mesophila]
MDTAPHVHAQRSLFLFLWAALWVLATIGPRHLGEWLGLGQLTKDSIGGLAYLTIAVVCGLESRSWLSFVLSFIPVYGMIHSARCFWRLAPPEPVTSPA